MSDVPRRDLVVPGDSSKNSSGVYASNGDSNKNPSDLHPGDSVRGLVEHTDATGQRQ